MTTPLKTAKRRIIDASTTKVSLDSILILQFYIENISLTLKDLIK